MSEPSFATPLEIGPALGRVPSGLYILTARDGSRASGMLASWVQQAGFSPPMLTVAIHQDRFLGDWVRRHGRFTLNQVPQQQKGLLKRFSRSFPPDESPFDGLAIRLEAEGGPVLDEALAFLDCKVAGQIGSGDHQVFLAEVVAGGVFAPEASPFVHIRQNGMHY